MRSLYLIACSFGLLLFSCNKTNNADIAPLPATAVIDLGYGCNTNVIQQAITNKTGRAFYLQAQNGWCIGLDLPNGHVVKPCGNNAAFNSLTAQHPNLETFPVTVSGNIKYREANQPPLAVDTPGAYHYIYAIDLTSASN